MKAKKAEEKEALKAKKAEEKEALKAKKAEEKEALKAKKAEEKEALKAEKLALETNITVKVEPELESTVVDSSNEEEEEVELPTIEVDGVTFLYDEDGSYSGVNHLLLTEEGTPVGTYDKETNKVTILEFEEE